MEQILKIAEFILKSFLHIWPYLTITIPLAVLVQFTGVSKYINKALGKKPLISIFLATVVGAFSPFCSCGVIPVIASLLISGVPLAPVMSFWIASPSMDPEIFFLSTASIGWELSIWRLASTFVISLGAGYITHYAYLKGYLGQEILRETPAYSFAKTLKKKVGLFITGLGRFFTIPPSPVDIEMKFYSVSSVNRKMNQCCAVNFDGLTLVKEEEIEKPVESCGCQNSCSKTEESFKKRLFIETGKATLMVAKFMGLAFFINALIQFYVPANLVSSVLGGKGNISVIIAALAGIPVYTSNITALPLISGLLELGMNKGAALAFLIAGPTTTLPAMMAVWGIVKKRIFFLYILFALVGAILTGLFYNLFC